MSTVGVQQGSFLAPDFHLQITIESGQVFGFSKFKEGYQGSFGGISLKLWQKDERLFFESDAHFSPREIELHLKHYFDLERNLSPLYTLLEQDPKIPSVLNRIRGLRLIRQDIWEAMACFILSSNNNIKRIQQIWHRLAKALGRDGKHFPNFEIIADSNEAFLRSLGLGYRAPYLLKSARLVCENVDILKKIDRTSYSEAKEILIKFPGVGSKVADCILLYGFHKMEAFPVDVWIERILRKLYFRNRSAKNLLSFAQKKWGLLGGYVQQYLFHGARTGILET